MEPIIQQFNNKINANKPVSEKKLTDCEKKVLIHRLRQDYSYVFAPTEGKQKRILNIANKRLAGDMYFTRYIDYITWIRNALLVTK